MYIQREREKVLKNIFVSFLCALKIIGYFSICMSKLCKLQIT